MRTQSAQMLLIWLLIPAASAMMDCRSACELCQTGLNQLARLNSCALCKECFLTVKRRMMELHLPNKRNLLVEGEVQFPSKGNMVLQGKVLSDKQMKELKNLEKKEFAEMMKDYGWQPRDFLEDDTPDNKDEPCALMKDCLRDSDEYKGQPKGDSIEKLINAPTSKTECPTSGQIVCPSVPQIVCPPYCMPTTVIQRTTSISCPPIIPCGERDKLKGAGTKSTMPFGRRKFFLRQLARLEAEEAEAMGCPPQPICSDDEDYQERLINTKKYTRRSTRFTSPRSTNKTPSKAQATCVACVPPCPLPCPLYPALFPPPIPPPIPVPYPLPQTIPPQALQALMTLLTTATPQKKEKTAYIDNSVDNNNEESDEEQEKMLSNEKAGKATKDYVILYARIPKDAKKLRRG